MLQTSFSRVAYTELNARQKENFNFHRAAAILAEYGYNSIRLTDDWGSADFLAYHIDGVQLLKVQLKARFTVEEKYLGKGLHIAFMQEDALYVFPHDEFYMLWYKREDRRGRQAFVRMPTLPRWLLGSLVPYRITASWKTT